MAQLTTALRVQAEPGEVLDALVWRVLGKAGGAVEAVLDANPGLAAIGHALPAGTVVVIPAGADAPVDKGLVQLWD